MLMDEIGNNMDGKSIIHLKILSFIPKRAIPSLKFLAIP